MLMAIGRYRITNPTLALFEEGGRHVAHTVSTGTVIMGLGDLEQSQFTPLVISQVAANQARDSRGCPRGLRSREVHHQRVEERAARMRAKYAVRPGPKQRR